MDIYTLIHNDHAAAVALMRQIRTMPDSRHQERLMLFHTLSADVIAHMDAEESSFYEALLQHHMTAPHAHNSEQEHHDIKARFEELRDRSLKPSTWKSKFEKLITVVERHIHEEEGEVFPMARAILTQESAVRLADIMERLKFMKKEFLKKAG